MSSQTRLSAALAAGIFLVLFEADAQVITEQDAIKTLLSQGPQTRELRSSVAVVEAETRGWSLWPNPEANYSREGAGVAHFWQAEQPLPVSGRRGYLRKAGSAAVAAARSQSGFALWQLVSNVRAAFYDVLASQGREAAIRSNLDRLQEIARILSEREKQGEGSTYDRLRAERERAEVEAELVSARVGTVQARSRLASLLGPNTEPSGLVASGQIETAPVAPPASDLFARALAIRGDYKARQKLVEQFLFAQRAAERLRIPEPSVIAGVKRAEVFAGMGTGPFVALSVPLPVFNKGKTEVARFRAEAERTQARCQTLEQQIFAELNGAYSALELRRGAADEYRRGFETQGQRLEQIAQTGYQEGELGILGLLDAWRVSLQSKLKLLELDTAAKQAEIELERVVGEPVLNKGILP